MKRIASMMMLVLLCAMIASPRTAALAASCAPTEEDAEGPFYKPGAPVRSSVGKGYVLRGVVRSSGDCSPLPGARIELWLAGPDGAMMMPTAPRSWPMHQGPTASKATCRLPTMGRPPHIHLKVSAKGFNEIVTQHYPVAGRNTAVFDVVLVPSR